MGRYEACMGEIKNAYSILVREIEGKKTLKRPSHKWKDSNRMDLREIGWEDVDEIHLIQDRGQCQALVSIIMNLQVP
jgi:hypothetical protein